MESCGHGITSSPTQGLEEVIVPAQVHRHFVMVWKGRNTTECALGTMAAGAARGSELGGRGVDERVQPAAQQGWGAALPLLLLLLGELHLLPWHLLIAVRPLEMVIAE